MKITPTPATALVLLSLLAAATTTAAAQGEGSPSLVATPAEIVEGSPSGPQPGRDGEPPLPFAITPELRKTGERLGRVPGGTKEKADAIVSFIFRDREGLRFEYRRHPTLTAAEAFEQRQGNCLTLVNLFIALARSAGLDAFPILVDDLVVFTRTDDTVLRSTHMISGMQVGADLWTLDFLPDRPKAYRRLRPISDRHHAALHYNSLAVEAMLGGHMDAAETYFRYATTLAPTLAETLSNYGVLARRTGQPELAEERMLAALERDPAFLPALNNLAALYHGQGRRRLAARYEQRALEARYQNPYFLLAMALRRLEAGEIDGARDLLQRARRIDRDIPEVYLLLGRVDLARGRPAAAERNFAAARKFSRELSVDFQEQVDRKIERLLLLASAD